MAGLILHTILCLTYFHFLRITAMGGNGLLGKGESQWGPLTGSWPGCAPVAYVFQSRAAPYQSSHCLSRRWSTWSRRQGEITESQRRPRRAEDEDKVHWDMELLPLNSSNPSWRKNCSYNSESSGKLSETHWAQETCQDQEAERVAGSTDPSLMLA